MCNRIGFKRNCFIFSLHLSLSPVFAGFVSLVPLCVESLHSLLPLTAESFINLSTHSNAKYAIKHPAAPKISFANSFRYQNQLLVADAANNSKYGTRSICSFSKRAFYCLAQQNLLISGHINDLQYLFIGVL